ncbi:hypothetical protein [Streptomyces sp. Ru62]|nr:hypothetical protein [Streptomyces sp. Ru62]
MRRKLSRFGVPSAPAIRSAATPPEIGGEGIVAEGLSPEVRP